MKGTVKQEDFSGGTEDQHLLSSSGRGEWTIGGGQRDMYIDLERKDHLESLKAWCRAHWLSTFKRSLMYGNKLTFHCCCTSFSRRSFVKGAGHPKLQSIGVLQIPALRDATSHTDLYNWLVEVIVETKKMGQRVLFPAVNRHHEEIEEDEWSHQGDSDVLAKRNLELEEELTKTRRQLVELRKDNDRLLQSSKSWYDKYEQLLDPGSAMMGMLSTPRKLKIMECCSSFED
jgi:hypothetical protein